MNVLFFFFLLLFYRWIWHSLSPSEVWALLSHSCFKLNNNPKPESLTSMKSETLSKGFDPFFLCVDKGSKGVTAPLFYLSGVPFFPSLLVFSFFIVFFFLPRGVWGTKMSSLNLEASLFFFILFLNLSGLLGFVYSLSSLYIFCGGVAFSFFLGVFLFSCLELGSAFFQHLVPLGAPALLLLVLFLVEVISFLIRPVTLSVRLSANILAGHLLLGLFSSTFMGLFFGVLELGVSLVQAFVFMLLLLTYWSESD